MGGTDGRSVSRGAGLVGTSGCNPRGAEDWLDETVAPVLACGGTVDADPHEGRGGSAPGMVSGSSFLVGILLVRPAFFAASLTLDIYVEEVLNDIPSFISSKIALLCER